jgi:hypothetical protein
MLGMARKGAERTGPKSRVPTVVSGEMPSAPNYRKQSHLGVIRIRLLSRRLLPLVEGEPGEADRTRTLSLARISTGSSLKRQKPRAGKWSRD